MTKIKTGVELIAEERKEQIKKHGRTMENCVIDEFIENSYPQLLGYCINKTKSYADGHDLCHDAILKFLEYKVKGEITDERLKIPFLFIIAETGFIDIFRKWHSRFKMYGITEGEFIKTTVDVGDSDIGFYKKLNVDWQSIFDKADLRLVEQRLMEMHFNDAKLFEISESLKINYSTIRVMIRRAISKIMNKVNKTNFGKYILESDESQINIRSTVTA